MVFVKVVFIFVVGNITFYSPGHVLVTKAQLENPPYRCLIKRHKDFHGYEIRCVDRNGRYLWAKDTKEDPRGLKVAAQKRGR